MRITTEKTKYYAVAYGRRNGIFNSWQQCKVQVENFIGANYKKFETEEEAIEFLKIHYDKKSPYFNTGKLYDGNVRDNTIDIYVDGSYSFEHDIYGFGIILVFGDGSVEKIYGGGTIPREYRNNSVLAELSATLTALTIIKNNFLFNKINLYYDCSAIVGVINSTKKTTPVIYNYRRKMKKLIKELNISFIKVKGHSYNYYHNLADKQSRIVLEEYKTRHIKFI